MRAPHIPRADGFVRGALISRKLAANTFCTVESPGRSSGNGALYRQTQDEVCCEPLAGRFSTLCCPLALHHLQRAFGDDIREAAKGQAQKAGCQQDKPGGARASAWIKFSDERVPGLHPSVEHATIRAPEAAGSGSEHRAVVIATTKDQLPITRKRCGLPFHEMARQPVAHYHAGSGG